MQIIGKRWKEMELLAIAEEIDGVAGSFKYPPGYIRITAPTRITR